MKKRGMTWALLGQLLGVLLLWGISAVPCALGQEQGKPETWKIVLLPNYVASDGYEASLDIANRQKAELNRLGFQNVVIIDVKDSSLAMICQRVKNEKAHILLVNAFAHFSDSKASGLAVYVHPKHASDSTALAERLHAKLRGRHEQYDRGVLSSLAFPICDCERTGCGKASVLIKYAFTSNEDDAKYFADDGNVRQDSAVRTCEAICDYTGVAYAKREEPKPEVAQPTSYPERPTRRYNVDTDMDVCSGELQVKPPMSIFNMDGTYAHERVDKPYKYGITYKTKDGLWYYQSRFQFLITADPSKGTFTPGN